jgi:predicted secreted Zn-dependent protease
VGRGGLSLHNTLGACALACLTLAAQAEVQESHALEPYPVHARPGQTLREALNAATPITSGGQRFHGYTHWNVRWNFWWQQDGAGRCRITRVSTRLQSRIQMPELATGTVAQTAAFARYHAALYQHELGHVEFGRKAAQAIDRGIAALPPAPDCPTLEQQANALGQRLLAEQAQQERDYDQRTRHGATQGALLTD